MIYKILAVLLLSVSFSGGGYLYWQKTSKAQYSLDEDYQSAATALDQLNVVAAANIMLYQRIEGVLRFIEQPGFSWGKCKCEAKQALQAWKIIAFLFAKHKVTWALDATRISYLSRFDKIPLEVDGAKTGDRAVPMTFDNLDTIKTTINGTSILDCIKN